MERKIITTEVTNEDKVNDESLRPKLLKDYVGQSRIKEHLKVYIDAAKSAASRWTMFFFTGLRDSARRPWQASLPMKWVLRSRLPRDPRLKSRARWPRF